MDALTKLSAATAALAEARTLDEVRKILDIAEAARTYARAAKLGLEAQNHAAEVKLRAERKAGELLKDLERGQGERNDLTSLQPVKKSSDYKQVLDESEINYTTAHRWQKVADVPEETFEQHIAEVKESRQELTTAGVLRVAKEEKRRDRNEIGAVDGARFELIHSAIEHLSLAENSVDTIITDPPYPREYLQTFSLLSWLAARVLKPGGSLFVMSGQSYLPEVICRLSEQMTYHWTLAYLTPGGQAVQLWQRKVNTFWKPVFWFVKGEYGGQWLGDVSSGKTNDNDKRFHGWGQSESGMIDLLLRCTEPGQTILDPFCGGGATGVAALATGRHFIGADIDKSCIDTCHRRLSEVVNAGLLC